MPARALTGYYAILDIPDSTLSGASRLEGLAEQTAQLLAANPCCLQLRAKRLGAADLRAAAARVLPLCRAAGIPFCLNDRVDVALAVGADFVHVGQDDLPLSEVRRLAGARLGVGVSTHNPDQARAAVDGGADYIGFGPVFGTRSKENPDPVVGLPALREVAAFGRGAGVPVVAIGGIDLDTVTEVAGAGASAAAVISAVDRAPDRTAAGRSVAAAFGSG
jgi:thiamine-phosphate pyrophosphorylase